MAKTVAQRQRAIRQEELRELISKKGLVQQVLVNLDKIENLQDGPEGEFELKKLKVSNDQRMALIKKYLPDMSHQSLEGELDVKTVVRRVDLSGTDEPSN